MEAPASTTKNLGTDEMIAMVMRAGDVAAKTIALLDEAHPSTYGHPEITEVNIGAGDNPGILDSGHDEGHGRAAQADRRHGGRHLHPRRDAACQHPYIERLFTTGVVSYPGAEHIAERPDGGAKDFPAVIELAKESAPPEEIESGTIVGGFAHNQVMALADEVVEAVKSGAIKRFVVMGGCDGRHRTRNCHTEVAENLPEDTVILTAGCAKYRYNKLDLGDIGGIPQGLNAGQCNDSYSLAVIVPKLKETFELDDINELPISYNIAWYEQKAVAVLLALLSLGVKGIRLGPTLPVFLSPQVAKVLIERFDVKPIGTVEDDIAAMMGGRSVQVGS